MRSPSGTPLPEEITIAGGQPVTGDLSVPGDKSVSHRSLMLGALAEGTTTITGLSDGDDVRRTRVAIEALGAGVADSAGLVQVEGGRGRLRPPVEALDCGNSGTALRLLAGLVAGLAGTTVLGGDESLSARPMDRIATPLGNMGAIVMGEGERCLPPITITGAKLHGIEWRAPVASAQVKSAILLAGLDASSATRVIEPVATRRHTEEMLASFGARISVTESDEGIVIELEPSSLVGRDVTVPGDPSQAAFWIVAGCVVPGSSVRVHDVYAGPTRTGFVDVLVRMGGQVALEPTADHLATMNAHSGPLHATIVHAHEIPSLDEVPALAVAAAVAEGTTTFLGMGELRVKEVDRLDAVRDLVESFGASANIVGDDLQIEGVGGAGALTAATFDSRGDHRMAMAAVVAALAAQGTSVITRFGAVETSYPQFLKHLGALGATHGVPDHMVGTRGHQDLLIAIDGPAGSGKSTLSRAIAEQLGVARLDTGAMYRSVAWAALERGVDPDDAEAVAQIAERAVIELEGDSVKVDGVDVTTAIRTAEVSGAVSVVAANPAVRREMVARQREWAKVHAGGVVEGRDIGSVVFPNATIKVFLTASLDERYRRRADEAPESVSRRDQIDSTRAASPLAVADGARVLDTTGRSVEDVVEEVLSWL